MTGADDRDLPGYIDASALGGLALEFAVGSGHLLRGGVISAVDAKSNANDVVTDLDHASEAHLVAAISAARPDDGLLGEEGARRTGSTGITWVIDPLDGTVNYVYGLPAWSVSVGVEFHGRPIAGAVVAPALAEAFVAWHGGGAYRLAWSDAAGAAGTQGSQRLACSSVTDLAGALIGTGFSYAPEDRARQGAVAAGLLPRVRDIRRYGSAALDLCFVAAGRLDGYYERGLNPWDLSAGTIIGREAGAVVTRDDSGLVVSAGPGLHAALREAVA